jgi:hypothetical protein
LAMAGAEIYKMNGIFLGFEIAAGMALFMFLLVLVMRRAVWTLPLRGWWYIRIARKRTPPPEVRRYLMTTGLNQLKNYPNLPTELQEKVAIEELAAVLEDDAFEGMAGDLIEDAFTRLGSVPLEHCTTCKCPVLRHEATRVGDSYYCETCGKAKKATL